MRRRGVGRWAPTVVVALVALLAGLSIGTSWMMARHLRQDASAIGQLFSGVFAGLNDPRPGAAEGALLRLGELVREKGLPLVVTDGLGQVTAADNLPFVAKLSDPRVAAFAKELDAARAPIQTSVGTVHYGPLPTERQLVLLSILQGVTLLVMVGVGFLAFRTSANARRDRVWVAMAREAAHQLGTPLTSLQGWIEQMRQGHTPPDALADFLHQDTERLARVARRFERIGSPAGRKTVGLGALAARVAEYFRPRLPRHANPITIEVQAAGPGPNVLGDEVLLEWALESLVKNAIDALKGRAGTITLEAGMSGDEAVLRVTDDGPGIPSELGLDIFEPGISSKTSGWGIGLALVKRVIEENHEGRVNVVPVPNGASFEIRMAASPLP
ncbi:MAG: HAMP domain-containing histidine kinase [Gemmatimonadetes bacterium]|nr:HAMP domain-containing histidine kinase [Gemmatimonadota bacterium]